MGLATAWLAANRIYGNQWTVDPVVLGQHAPVSEMIKANARRWKRMLAIEISYGIENYNINCDLLLLFTEDSIKTLNYKVEFLLEE